MPSTNDITLENWPAKSVDRKALRGRYHLACRQHSVSFDCLIQGYFRAEELTLHTFDQFSELLFICQRNEIDAILIAGTTDFDAEIKLVQAIKGNVFMSSIPVVLYHPEPDERAVIAAYESGAEEFIYGEWRPKLVEVKLRRLIDRGRRDVSVNPSTRLPGPAMIETEISHQLLMGSQFALCYADLDNFKAYNDHYGYVAGDKVIRLTARVIKDVVVDLCQAGFVGHIAGDDFIYTVPAEIMDRACREIIKTFDILIRYRYSEADRERGSILAVNRRGQLEQFELLSISIAAINVLPGRFSHVGQLSKMLADLKKAAKMKPGSAYVVERRAPY